MKTNLSGIRIKELRNEKGISQAALAEILGVARMTVVNYENGRNTPETDVLIKASVYFGVSIDYILGLSDFRTIAEEEEHLENEGLLIRKLKNLTSIEKSEIVYALNYFFEIYGSFPKIHPGAHFELNIIEGLSSSILSFASMLETFKDTIDNVQLDDVSKHASIVASLVCDKERSISETNSLYVTMLTLLENQLQLEGCNYNFKKNEKAKCEEVKLRFEDFRLKE